MTSPLYKRPRWKMLVLFVLAALLSGRVEAQLSGTYTINPSGSGSTNFTSFTQAVDTLKKYGVSGAVTFNVSDGTYTERVLIRPVTGASATNRITFTSGSGDSSKVILTQVSSTSSTNNYTLMLDSADYITLSRMTIQRTGSSTYGRVVVIHNDANYNQLLNNQIIGVTTTSSTTPENRAGIFSDDDNDDYTVIQNNLIKKGANGFHWEGDLSTSLEKGTVITGNILDSIYFYNIRIYKQDSATISDNIIMNSGAAGAYGIQTNNHDNYQRILRNKIYLPNGGYGIHVQTSKGTVSNPGITANNFITVGGTGTAYGLYIDNSSNQNIYYNSVNITSTSTTGRGIYVYSSSSTGTHDSVNVVNNNFANTGGGYAYYINSNAVTIGMLLTSDYNNLYSTGSSVAYYSSGAVTDLSAWQTASSKDANSVSANPRFKSAADLHTQAVILNSAATPLTSVTTDIDRQTRNSTTPDIGADEFDPPAVDAAVTAIVSPGQTCSASQTLSVRVRNSGIDTLKSVTLTFLLNGVQQAQNTYTVNIVSTKDTVLTVSNINLTGTAQQVTVYVSDPNSTPDPTNTNDTVKGVFRLGLNGTYTIGATGADFKNFNEAAALLNAYGVCGPVTFNVNDGTYQEQVVLGEIFNTSATNTITFQSISGDSSKAILTLPTSTVSTNNYLLLLDGTDYVTFRELTFERTGTSTYGRIIVMQNGATRNQFISNRIMAAAATSSTTNRANVYSGDFNDNYNTFRNNLLKKGSHAIYWYGEGTSSLEKGTVFVGNIIDSAYAYSMYLYYQDSITITDNVITNALSTTAYGIRVAYGDNTLRVLRNKVDLPNGGYGIYIYYSDATASNPGLTANNFVSIGGAGDAYGLYLYNSNYQNLVYNSVNITSTDVAEGRAFYGYSSSSTATYSNNSLLNNILANNGGGYAYYMNANAVTVKLLDTSDYNDIYSSGSNLGYYGSSDVADLSVLRTASSMDANSISVKPNFASRTDLHVRSAVLNAKASALSYVTTDIDGETRSSTPDIGADEFVPPADELMLAAIIEPVTNACGDSSTVVAVVIQNMGTNSQSNFTVSANVTGATTATLSQTYSGTLAGGARDTVYFTTPLNTFSGGTFNITAFTSLSGDADLSNDTSRTSVKINATPARPTASAKAVCAGDSATIAGVPSATGQGLFWYTSDTAAKAIAIMDTFMTPALFNTTTYYVAAAGLQTVRVGPLDSSIGGGGYSTAVYNVFFNADQPLTIDSVAVHGNGIGYVSVELYDANNNKLDGGTFNVTRRGKFFIPVNFSVPAGKGYYLKWDRPNSNINLWRNTAGATYPFTSSPISITGHSFTSGPNYFYNFYDWHVTVFGCQSDRVPVTVTVNPKPAGVDILQGTPFGGSFNAGTANTPDEVCVGDSIAYELDPPSGFTNSQFGTGWIITQLDFMTANGTSTKDTLLRLPSPLGNGRLLFTPTSTFGDSTFIMTVTVANMSTGCDTTLMRYVKVNPTPEAAFSFSNGCAGTSIQFTNSSTPSANVSYMWYFGDGATDNNQSPSHTYAQAGTYTVSLVVSNAAGCADSISRSIIINPAPQASFTATDECAGTATTFTSTSTISSGSIASYLWRFGDGDSSTSMAPTHTYAVAGTYNITLVVTSDSGCTSTATGTVSVFAMPAASFTGVDSICVGSAATLTSTSTNADSTFWYVDGVLSGNGTTLQINPTQLVDVQVQLVVKTVNGCTSTITDTIRVLDVPAAIFSTQFTCEGDTTVFTSTSTGTGLTYAWSFGDGGTSTDMSPMHRFAAAGSYDVTLVVTNTSGCMDSVMQTVVINPTPVAGFTVQNGCKGDAIAFTNTSAISSGAISSYLWDFGDGDTSSAMNPVHSYAVAGPYTVTLTAFTGSGCTNMVSQTLIIYQRAEVDFGFINTCEGNTTFFFDSTTLAQGIASYEWDFGDGDTSSQQHVQHMYAAAGTYTVTLRVTTDNGCTDSAIRTVTIGSNPVAGFTATDACVGEANAFTDTTSAAVTEWLWLFGDGDSSTVQNPTHTYAAVGQYDVVLVVRTAGGCVDSATQTVDVFELPDAAFTYQSAANGVVTFTPAQTGLTTYKWLFGDGDSSTAASPTHTYAGNGAYTVTLVTTNANGCTATTTQTLDITTIGFDKPQANKLEMKVYPNPVQERTTVAYTLTQGTRVVISVTDMQGRVVMNQDLGWQTAGQYKHQMETSALPAGQYQIGIQTESQRAAVPVIRVR